MVPLIAISMLLYLAWETHKLAPRPHSVYLQSANGVVCQALLLKTWSQKRVGLLNHNNIASDAGVLLTKTKQIHTVGMAFSIDVVFLSSDYRVLAICESIPPNKTKVMAPKGSACALELKSYSVRGYYQWKLGEQLSLKEVEQRTRVGNIPCR